MLKRMGLKADLVENGQAALDAVRAACYDIILMDCQMPIMDGYEASRSIRESRPDDFHDVPIIAATANSMDGDREKCFAAGMSDYVVKPYKAADLEQALKRQLEKSSKSS